MISNIEEDIEWAQELCGVDKRSPVNNLGKSSWSGDSLEVIQLMIYLQLKRIADSLEKVEGGKP